MAKFTVELDPKFHIIYVEVEADTAEEAMRKAVDGYEWTGDHSPCAMEALNAYIEDVRPAYDPSKVISEMELAGNPK